MPILKGITGFKPIVATGGNITEAVIDGKRYRIHAFTDVGSHTFEVTNAGTLGTIDVLIVAGGGGGADIHRRGGGGAGELKFIPNYQINNNNYSLTVGNGGPNGEQGVNGGNSLFDSITSIGGGGGGASGTAGSDGGSGGGGGRGSGLNGGGSSLATNPPNGIGLGNDGGGTPSTTVSGGGGGAGEKGKDGSGDFGGDGGDGVKEVTVNNVTYNFAQTFGAGFGTNDDNDGNRWFAGGGGGGTSIGNLFNANGGKGGGVPGSINNDPNGSDNAIPNTGAGGNCGTFTGSPQPGGDGGSGIVLIRYPLEKQITKIYKGEDEIERIWLGDNKLVFGAIKPEIYELVASIDTGTTSATEITGLNILPEEEYRIVYWFRGDSTSTTGVSIFINGNNTNANYTKQRGLSSSGGDVVGQQASNTEFTACRNDIFSGGYIDFKITSSDNKFVALSKSSVFAGTNDTTLQRRHGNIVSNFTVSSITSIRFTYTRDVRSPSRIILYKVAK